MTEKYTAWIVSEDYTHAAQIIGSQEMVDALIDILENAGAQYMEEPCEWVLPINADAMLTGRSKTGERS